MQARSIRSPIYCFNAYANIFRGRLPVFDKYIEITIVIEDACIEKFKLKSLALALSVLIQMPFVRIRRLRIFVEVLHVGMRWSAVEVEVIFLHVLPMISFARGQPEGPLLQNRIF